MNMAMKRISDILISYSRRNIKLYVIILLTMRISPKNNKQKPPTNLENTVNIEWNMRV